MLAGPHFDQDSSTVKHIQRVEGMGSRDEWLFGCFIAISSNDRGKGTEQESLPKQEPRPVMADSRCSK